LIKNPSVGINMAKMKYVNHANKVTLSFKTTITKCDDFHGPVNAFNFTSFQELHNKSIPEFSIVGMYAFR
jgi:hypothetical protein